MSADKKVQEDDEDRGYVATAIAIAAGVLRVCADHSTIPVSVDDADILDAFKLATDMYQAGHLRDFFKSRRQLLASIKAAVAGHQGPCPVCEPTRPH
jgi:hypothetical protein